MPDSFSHTAGTREGRFVRSIGHCSGTVSRTIVVVFFAAFFFCLFFLFLLIPEGFEERARVVIRLGTECCLYEKIGFHDTNNYRSVT